MWQNIEILFLSPSSSSSDILKVRDVRKLFIAKLLRTPAKTVDLVKQIKLLRQLSGPDMAAYLYRASQKKLKQGGEAFQKKNSGAPC